MLCSKGPKSSMLAPLVSVDEILDVRIETKDSRHMSDDSTPSPRSPQLLIGRGLNFDAPAAQASVSLTEPTTKTKINGQPPNSTSAIGGSSGAPATLPELKKQRSYNRLSEVHGNDAAPDVVINAKTFPDTPPSASVDSDKNANAQLALRASDPLIDTSKPRLVSPGKAPERRADFGRRCCIII